MRNERKRLMLLGLAFLALLIISYFVNVIFFETLSTLLQNQLLAFFMFFIHNITVISLIQLGMTFYVNLVVLGFFKGQEYEYVLLEHPRPFAIVFTIAIIFVSILRGITLIFGGINVEALPRILLASAPIGIIEGYGIFQCIQKTLKKSMTLKDLTFIYSIFFIAAVLEVGLVQALLWITSR